MCDSDGGREGVGGGGWGGQLVLSARRVSWDVESGDSRASLWETGRGKVRRGGGFPLLAAGVGVDGPGQGGQGGHPAHTPQLLQAMHDISATSHTVFPGADDSSLLGDPPPPPRPIHSPHVRTGTLHSIVFCSRYPSPNIYC